MTDIENQVLQAARGEAAARVELYRMASRREAGDQIPDAAMRQQAMNHRHLHDQLQAAAQDLLAADPERKVS